MITIKKIEQKEKKRGGILTEKERSEIYAKKFKDEKFKIESELNQINSERSSLQNNLGESNNV